VLVVLSDCLCDVLVASVDGATVVSLKHTKQHSLMHPPRSSVLQPTLFNVVFRKEKIADETANSR